jgi:hypothetical protein
VLGFLSGEAGSKLPDIANALCSCLSLTSDVVDTLQTVPRHLTPSLGEGRRLLATKFAG